MDAVRFHLHAWVVMPNHVHIVFEPLGGSRVGRLVATWKTVSAKRILGRASQGRPQTLWQVDYFDRFIRDARHYALAIDYIHRNPVMAGLVERAEHWPWSSAREWAEGHGQRV
jgi:REP element-mobilizing transposase RayT